ncbi:hypothetical protein [Ideonella sp.]|uniref:hypothetical protein n=1 Tax=Ideonella sp. TaxID=1929293 RepID=UPI002B460D8D|nr:hypothetical protein [Ideonella sp.]HJV70061.1 hypothetical protein [Ideonella sp.]
MAATQTPQSDAGKEEPRDGQVPVPDEAGPHDVPDDEVIEQTLPETRPGRDSKPK